MNQSRRSDSEGHLEGIRTPLDPEKRGRRNPTQPLGAKRPRTAADWAKRKGMGEEAVQYARSYAMEAERRMGELLAATPRQHGARGVG